MENKSLKMTEKSTNIQMVKIKKFNCKHVHVVEYAKENK